MKWGHQIVTSAQAPDLAQVSGQPRPPERPRPLRIAHYGEVPRPDAADTQDVPADVQRALVLTPCAESARAAREFTTSTLRDWHIEALVDDAVIVASELVTNAVRHGMTVPAASSAASSLELAWKRQDGRVVCVVTDSSCDAPMLEDADTDRESGRGLQVVCALAAACGWVMLGSRGKAVWAAFRCV